MPGGQCGVDSTVRLAALAVLERKDDVLDGRTEQRKPKHAVHSPLAWRQGNAENAFELIAVVLAVMAYLSEIREHSCAATAQVNEKSVLEHLVAQAAGKGDELQRSHGFTT